MLTCFMSSPSGVVYVGGCVYAVGGFNGSLRVRTVDCYDPMMDRWTSVSSMQDRRSTLGASVLNGLLYAVGGFDGSTGAVIDSSFLEAPAEQLIESKMQNKYSLKHKVVTPVVCVCLQVWLQSRPTTPRQTSGSMCYP